MKQAGYTVHKINGEKYILFQQKEFMMMQVEIYIHICIILAEYLLFISKSFIYEKKISKIRLNSLTFCIFRRQRTILCFTFIPTREQAKL